MKRRRIYIRERLLGSHMISNSISSTVLKITITKNIITKTKMISMSEFSTNSNMIIKRPIVKRNAFKKNYLSRIVKMIVLMNIPITKKNIYDRTRRKLTTFYLWTKTQNK